MKKRLLSVLLTLCMILTLLPVSAFAAGDPDYEAEHFANISKRNIDSNNQQTLAYAI